MKIALMCFSTARLVSTSDSAIASLLLPCAISASVSRSRGVSTASGESAVARLRTSSSTIFGSMYEPPCCTARTASTSCAAVVDTLLEQVGAPRGAGLEQLEHVGGLGVLAEHDDTGLRVRLAQARGDADALVGLRRRHPDVGDDDVRRLGLDRRHQGVGVRDGRDELDVRRVREQPRHRLADEEASSATTTRTAMARTLLRRRSMGRQVCVARPDPL